MGMAMSKHALRHYETLTDAVETFYRSMDRVRSLMEDHFNHDPNAYEQYKCNFALFMQDVIERMEQEAVSIKAKLLEKERQTEMAENPDSPAPAPVVTPEPELTADRSAKDETKYE